MSSAILDSLRGQVKASKNKRKGSNRKKGEQRKPEEQQRCGVLPRSPQVTQLLHRDPGPRSGGQSASSPRPIPHSCRADPAFATPQTC